jgi:hypothetical protein
MNYIIEALFVGIYSTVIYLLVNPFFYDNIFIILLVVGFIKHYLSYFIGLHTIYCKYGEACNKYNLYKGFLTTTKNDNFLLQESISESLLYLLVGSILYILIGNKPIYIFFLIGFILHISFEKLQVHDLFCRKRCTLNIIPN